MKRRSAPGFLLLVGMASGAVLLSLHFRGSGELVLGRCPKRPPVTARAASLDPVSRPEELGPESPPHAPHAFRCDGIRVHVPPSDESENALLVSRLYGGAARKERVESIHRLFTRLHQPGFEPVLQAFLHAAQNDPDAEVRRNALYCLVREPHPEAFDAAMRSLVVDRADEVRRSILQHVDKLATHPDSYATFIRKYLSTLRVGDPSVDVGKLSSGLVRQRRPQLLEALEKRSASSEGGTGATRSELRLKEALATPWMMDE
jgi:hypothetical protein